MLLAALIANVPSALAAGQQTASAASPGEQDQVALLAASCTGCHGASKGNALPALYGRRANRLKKYLLGYKSGKRKGTLMPRIVRGYSDEQLTSQANYFSSAKASGR